MVKKAVVAKVKTTNAKAVEFKLRAPEAKRVSLAGSFNNWNANSLAARKDARGIWTIKAAFVPGKYEYKFVVDGSWINDPICKESVPNTLGSTNSVLVIR